MKHIQIFTDGACSGNPGPGGWGAILRYKAHEKELSGGEAETTNNRMELMALIAALEQLKEPCEIDLCSDSQYVINGLQKGWAKGWRARWTRATRTPFTTTGSRAMRAIRRMSGVTGWPWSRASALAAARHNAPATHAHFPDFCMDFSAILWLNPPKHFFRGDFLW